MTLEIQKKEGGILYKDEFRQLPKDERLKIIKDEFIKCSKDIEYYIKHYAFVRHPNAGIIKFKPFDFQIDVIRAVGKALLAGRTKAYDELVNLYPPKFDYKRWLERIEKNIELLKKVPKEIHEQYTVWIDIPQWRATPDFIILKSRQTGLSTTFEHITNWYANFHTNTVSLIVSQRDKEAKKFLADIKIYYQLLPPYLRAKSLKDNDHELFLSITGDKKDMSIIQSFAPSPDAGRSYSPNFVILDEFAMYKKAEELWTAISMSVSAGGIICIISTPKGVGNLYHKLWTESVKNTRAFISAPKDKKEFIKPFKPYVVHWTQLPEEEFKRRGFKDGLEWYEFMKSKLISEGGLKKVAQELDLEFLASGDTVIPPDIINHLKNNRCIENEIKEPMKLKVNDKSIDEIGKLIYQSVGIDVDRIMSILNEIRNELRGVLIYRKPKQNEEYLIGVDTAEGIGKDYSVFYVMNIPKDDDVPKLYAYFSSNTIPPRKFAYLIFTIAILYNDAYLNIERNSVGMTIIELLEEIYKPVKIINTYNPNKKDIERFSKNEKGWKETSTTRQYLLDNFVDFIINYKDVCEVNCPLVDELYTFIDTGKRYEHMKGYHDDNIFAYGLTIVGIRILPKYLQFIEEKASDELSQLTNIPSDIAVASSIIKDDSNIELPQSMKDELSRRGITKEKLMEKYIKHVAKTKGIDIDDENIQEELIRKRLLKLEGNETKEERKKEDELNPTGHKFLSHEIVIDEDDDVFVF